MGSSWQKQAKVQMSLEPCHADALGVFGGGQQFLTDEAGCLRKGEIELEGSEVEGVHLAELIAGEGDEYCLDGSGSGLD